MSSSKIPSPLRTADYEAIETALLESSRGRWFLSEFSRRNRSADTHVLLEAITKLESAVLRPRATANTDLIRRDLIEMSEAIARTRQEIAAIKSPELEESQLITATEELDAIVASTEKATSDILEAAEDIQETAWLLRESGTPAESCSRLDERATDIYTACSFQDLTGQRTQKIVQALHFLESRVNSMVDIWGLREVVPQRGGSDSDRPDAHLLNGPQIEGRGLEQGDIDVMIGDADTDIEVVEVEALPEPDEAPVAVAADAEPMVAEPAVMDAAAEPERPVAALDVAEDVAGAADMAAPAPEAPVETPSLDVHPAAPAAETEAVPGPAVAAPEPEAADETPAPVAAPEAVVESGETHADVSASPAPAQQMPEPTASAAPAATPEPAPAQSGTAGVVVQVSEPAGVSELTIGDLSQAQRSALFS